MIEELLNNFERKELNKESKRNEKCDNKLYENSKEIITKYDKFHIFRYFGWS